MQYTLSLLPATIYGTPLLHRRHHPFPDHVPSSPPRPLPMAIAFCGSHHDHNKSFSPPHHPTNTTTTAHSSSIGLPPRLRRWRWLPRPPDYRHTTDFGHYTSLHLLCHPRTTSTQCPLLTSPPFSVTCPSSICLAAHTYRSTFLSLLPPLLLPTSRPEYFSPTRFNPTPLSHTQTKLSPIATSPFTHVYTTRPSVPALSFDESTTTQPPTIRPVQSHPRFHLAPHATTQAPPTSLTHPTALMLMWQTPGPVRRSLLHMSKTPQIHFV